MSPWKTVLLAISVAALAGACTDDDDPANAPVDLPPRDPALADFLEDEFGLVITASGDTDPQFFQDVDGFLVGRTIVRVELEGHDSRTIQIDQRIEPAAAGGEIFVQVQEVEGGAQRFFLYDFDEGYIVFGQDVDDDASRGVGVQRNPDGTYDVWSFDDTVSDRTETEVVADGFTAMRRVEAVNGFAALPPHIIMTAYALGQTEAPEARTPINSAKDNVAFTPAACSIFKAFCDCVACRILERDGGCALCPAL